MKVVPTESGLRLSAHNYIAFATFETFCKKTLCELPSGRISSDSFVNTSRASVSPGPRDHGVPSTGLGEVSLCGGKRSVSMACEYSIATLPACSSRVPFDKSAKL